MHKDFFLVMGIEAPGIRPVRPSLSLIYPTLYPQLLRVQFIPHVVFYNGRVLHASVCSNSFFFLAMIFRPLGAMIGLLSNGEHLYCFHLLAVYKCYYESMPTPKASLGNLDLAFLTPTKEKQAGGIAQHLHTCLACVRVQTPV